MDDKPFMGTREVAQFLGVNEKMVYSLVSEKGLPATKITGKWLFPRHLVKQWLEGHIVNAPDTASSTRSEGTLIIAGSHDVLLDRMLGLFNRLHPKNLALFGNLGSQGGLRTLAKGLCHMASCHLLQRDEEEYNFEYMVQEIEGELPAVVNFCRREQGLIIEKDNPLNIRAMSDLGNKGVRIVNRPAGTGTRLLFDLELEKAGLDGKNISGYDRSFRGHLDVGLEVLSGRAHATPGIRTVAGLLGLGFIPLRWERYDLLVSKERFFDEVVQLFLGLLHDTSFRKLADGLEGYDLSLCGKIVFPEKNGAGG
jgi:excisionase family DNA binding protein